MIWFCRRVTYFGPFHDGHWIVLKRKSINYYCGRRFDWNGWNTLFFHSYLKTFLEIGRAFTPFKRNRYGDQRNLRRHPPHGWLAAPSHLTEENQRLKKVTTSLWSLFNKLMPLCQYAEWWLILPDNLKLHQRFSNYFHPHWLHFQTPECHKHWPRWSA